MDYSDLTKEEINRKIATINVGLVLLENMPEFNREDPRWEERWEEYQKQRHELEKELERRKGVTVKAKSAVIGITAKSE